MVSVKNKEAKEFFARDITCIKTFFWKRFGIGAEELPELDDVEQIEELDKAVKASGYDFKKDEKLLQSARKDFIDDDEVDDDELLKTERFLALKTTNEGNDEMVNVVVYLEASSDILDEVEVDDILLDDELDDVDDDEIDEVRVLIDRIEATIDDEVVDEVSEILQELLDVDASEY
jgi:hypothetical protein